MVAAKASLGTVGIVRPTQRTAGYEDLLRMLPPGIGVVALCLDVRRGAIDEFKEAIAGYEGESRGACQHGCRCHQCRFGERRRDAAAPQPALRAAARCDR